MRTPPNLNGDLLTYDDVARALQVSKRTVRRRVLDGSLRQVKIGASTRFRREDVSYLIAKSRVN